MATIGIDGLSLAVVSPTTPQGANNVAALWNRGGIAGVDLSPIGSTSVVVVNTGTTTQAVYRGLVGAAYVYATGSPPGGGATNIVITGYV